MKKTKRILVQLLFATLLPCLMGKPFDGFSVITMTSGSMVTVFLWASYQMITMIHLRIYVIAVSNDLLVLYKKERQENFIYCTNFCVLNLIFPPWPHQPASHLTYFKNVSDNSKKYLKELFKFHYRNFGGKQFFLNSKKLQHKETRKIGET